MAYAIIRAAKIKTKRDFTNALAHNFRLKDVPNADTKISNDYGGYTANDVKKEFAKLFENDGAPFKKRRSDAVLCIEYMVTASPDFFQENGNEPDKIDGFFADSLKFLQDKHGAKNVMYAVRHNDETTPHMHIFVVPEYNGKLNCKHYLGGTKKTLVELQDSFHSAVCKYGLWRGKSSKETKAKHTDIKQYYQHVNEIKAIKGQYEDYTQAKSHEELLETANYLYAENEELDNKLNRLSREKWELQEQNEQLKCEYQTAYTRLETQLKLKMERNNERYKQSNRSITSRRNYLNRRAAMVGDNGKGFGEVGDVDGGIRIRQVRRKFKSLIERFRNESANVYLGEFVGEVREFEREFGLLETGFRQLRDWRSRVDFAPRLGRGF